MNSMLRMAPLGSRDGADPKRRAPKILVLVTEDWFAVSHFMPLLRTMLSLSGEVVVATKVGSKRAMIERTGARVVDFDYKRGSLKPGQDTLSAARLLRLIWRERPDAIHAIALKPIALACAVRWAAPKTALVLHLTGTGYAGVAPSGATAWVRNALFRAIAATAGQPATHLLVENADDLTRLDRFRALPAGSVDLVGGAGIDPDAFPAMPDPAGDTISAGFVGRLIWSKGIDVLIAARDILKARGSPPDVKICGEPDAGNPRAVPFSTLEEWSLRPGVHLLGRVDAIAAFWRATHIAVVPSRGGEGLPRALLEAAACARPIIASDVPGCREFIRNGVEGLLVPPDEPEALAAAIARLAGDASLRAKMGAAARQRVLEGYTEQHVEALIRDCYRRLLQPTVP